MTESRGLHVKSRATQNRRSENHGTFRDFQITVIMIFVKPQVRKSRTKSRPSQATESRRPPLEGGGVLGGWPPAAR